MRIEEFNALPAEEAAALVRRCADVSSFAAAVVAGRPYASAGDLLEAARRQPGTWSDADVEGALADHPRIGQRPAGEGPSAAMSRREQAGAASADPEVLRRLAEGNRRYEERFGRIYLVRAAGRTGAELLDLLERRLGSDPQSERAATRRELAEIALLRLEGLVPA